MQKSINTTIISSGMNQISAELSIAKSLSSLIDVELNDGSLNLTNEDIQNLATISFRQIEYINEEFQKIIDLLGI